MPSFLAYRVATKGDCGILRLLLKHGAKVNVRNKNGDTPLVKLFILKYISLSLSLSMNIYIYIYIYREREREICLYV